MKEIYITNKFHNGSTKVQINKKHIVQTIFPLHSIEDGNFGQSLLSSHILFRKAQITSN